MLKQEDCQFFNYQALIYASVFFYIFVNCSLLRFTSNTAFYEFQS